MSASRNRAAAAGRPRLDSYLRGNDEGRERRPEAACDEPAPRGLRFLEPSVHAGDHAYRGFQDPEGSIFYLISYSGQAASG